MTTTATISRLEHVTLIRDALDALLKARLEHDQRCDEMPPKPIKFVRFDNFDATRSRFEGIIEDPVRAALRRVMNDLGKELFKLVGSIEVMLAICNEVASRDPKREGRRLSIIDSAWNGIGDDRGRWWS